MWLVIGSDSQIGNALLQHLQFRGEPVLGTTRRAGRSSRDFIHFDLGQPPQDWRIPEGITAACICAAVARLADCAADPIGSADVNVTQTLALIDRLLISGASVVFLSSNQVFDGRTPNVAPNAPLSPISEYGRQKAAVEERLKIAMDSQRTISILRLAKVVPTQSALFADWTRRFYIDEKVSAFSDMRLAPVPVGIVTAAIHRMMADRAVGFFQLSGPRDISYAELAGEMAKHLGRGTDLVVESSSFDAGLPPGCNPKHTTMDSSALRERYGITVPDVSSLVDQFVGDVRSLTGD